MPKGKLKVYKSSKGKLIVELDKLNGKNPMPLSFMANIVKDDSLNGKECEYTEVGGQIKTIAVDGKQIYPLGAAPVASRTNNDGAGRGNQIPNSTWRDSLKIDETCLPKDVRALPIAEGEIDNFMLKYYKAARFDSDYDKGKGKFLFYRNDYRPANPKNGNPASGDKYQINANFGHLNWQAITARQQRAAASVCKALDTLIFEPDTRMTIGIGGGGASIYEVGMTLHHIYGCPYIPSSSIKGVLRSWIIAELFGLPDEQGEKDFPMVNAEHRAYQNAVFCLLFGCPAETQAVRFKDKKPVRKKDRQGNDTKDYEKENAIPVALKGKDGKGQEHQGILSFFDALPSSAPQVVVDIMNPHYPEWYDGSKLPTDTQNPRPIHFLTVARGTTFQMCFGGESNPTIKDVIKGSDDYKIFIGQTQLNSETRLLDLVKHWLTSALTNHGIGAKTAVGYGYMKP